MDRINTDPKFRDKMSKVNRSFLVEFDGKQFYNFKVENGSISEISEGNLPGDITISVDSATFGKIISNEMDPMVAYYEKKLQIKASLMDKILLTEIFK
jgi:putative sterol carrier protein